MSIGCRHDVPAPVSHATATVAHTGIRCISDREEAFVALAAFRGPEATAAGSSGNRGRDFGDERNEIGST